MRGLISNLRYTVRILLKSPGFTITAILILALGIGANTAIFSLVNGVLLKPLPYPNPDRLVEIYATVPGFDTFGLAYPDYLDFRRDQRSFVGLSGYATHSFALTGRGEAELISGVYASGGLFKVLGGPFLLGAPFGETEDKSEMRPVVVISEHLWKSKFQKDPHVLGQSLSLDGRSFEIIGVTAAQANEWGGVDVYVPLNQSPFLPQVEKIRGAYFLRAVGRLKDGLTLQQARADLQAINQRLVAEYPDTNNATGVRLLSYLDAVVGDYTAGLWLLEVSVVCLLLITCANIANLLIARMQDRRREMTIRAALGASRLQLFSRLFLETLMLALAGGVLGLVLAFWAVNCMRSLCPEDITRFQEIEVNQGSLIFVFALSLCTAVLAGVLPALTASKGDITLALAHGGERAATAGPLRQKKQAWLVGGQVALTFVLLIGAGLLTRSYAVLVGNPLGFNTHNVLTGDVNLSPSKYPNADKCRTLFAKVIDELDRLPGVSGVALDNDLPFKNEGANLFGVVGQPDPEPGHEPVTIPQVVSNDYFSVLGIRLLQGRRFNEQDQPDKERVVIVNESLAEHFFPGQDPIGKQLYDADDKVGGKRELYTIVGVVTDIEHQNPERQHATFQTYYPYTQFGPLYRATLVVAVKNNNPSTLVESVRKSIASIDPDLPFSRIAAFDDIVGKGFVARRLSLFAAGFFAGAAVLLAGVGLYAVLSYSVNQRRREVGVRIALGAQVLDILRLVLTQGIRIILAGLGVGIVGALIMARFIQATLYEVSSVDPLAFLIAILTLGLVALFACLLPASRAARINPIKALRE